MKYLLLVLPFLVSCAALHHVQVGDIQTGKGYALIPFEIKVSEMGVDLGDVQNIAKLANNSGGDGLGDVAGIIALFQLGPVTGAPVYDQRYAEKVIYQIYEKCPSGAVTGLNSIRETRKYPVISGEIIKITGYCMKARQAATDTKTDKDI